MMFTTLRQVYDSLEFGGKFICNYPSSPRKMDLLTARDLEYMLRKTFGGSVERVGGTSSAPLWVVYKPFLN